jgi:AraC-like DNA-binding protein
MKEVIFSLFPHENFFDLTIYQFGYEQCRPLYSFGPATRNHFLFHYILSGRGRLMSTDDSAQTNDYYLKGDQGFLMWPGQNNTYMADEKQPWEYAWIEFDGLRAKELVILSGLLFNSPIYTDQNTKERQRMKDELMYIITHARNAPLELMGHFYLFLSALISSSSLRKTIPEGTLQDFYVREAVSFIEQHYQNNISVEDIASFCNLNRSYLGRIFKTVLQSTPQDFLISYRLKKACELLKITDRPIGEISVMVGYPNQFNFSRAFKQELGKSPQEWRKENRPR